MSKINFPKKQEQRLIPKYLLEYSEELVKNHPDPSAEWGGSGVADIEAGTGIEITGETTKTISIDNTIVATQEYVQDYVEEHPGPQGPAGPQGPKGEQGPAGADGLTTSVTVNGTTYTQTSGNITLPNYPTVPTVNNATISLYQGNTLKGSFTVNQGSNASIYLDAGTSSNVPHLTDNSITGLATEATYGSNKPSISISDFTTAIPTTYKLNLPEKNGTFATLDDIPTVPTNVSAFTNDAGYITGITSSDVTTALGYTPGTSNFSGDYDDLTDKPDLSVYELKSEAFSGDYNDLTNKPTVPTKTSDLTNDSGFITGITSSMVTTALGYTPGTSNFSGSYTDLTDKPTIPTVVDTVADGNMNAVTSNAVYNIVGDIETLLAAL